MKTFIILLIAFSTIFAQRVDRIQQITSSLAEFWDKSDTNFVFCDQQNLTFTACSASFKTLLDEYCFSDLVTLYPEFTGPTPLVGTQAVADAFAFVYATLGSGGEHHVFSVPIIHSGAGSDPGVVNVTTRGITVATNYLTNETFFFLDKKRTSFERRQGEWKIAVFDFTLITSNKFNTTSPWSIPRF